MLKELLASESLQSIDKLLANIADSLGVGVDMLKENGMQYILQYGEYAFWSGFTYTFIFTTLIFAIIAIIILATFAEADDLTIKTFVWIVMITLFIEVIFLIIISLPYIISPEMYSIKQVLELLQ